MVLRGTNQEFGGPYNRRIVLEAIRLHGPTTRRDIARRVGLTVQTVSTIVRELEEGGYVLSARAEPKKRGLPPATLSINPDGGYAVGIHVTPIGIDAALVDLSGEVVASGRREAPNATPDHAFELIGNLVSELAGMKAGQRILGIGLALPGPFGVEKMSFIGPTTMAGWNDIALAERLSDSTGLPAFLETDMAAAALGERLYGLGAGFSDYYYLYFGVGLGGVMVHDGIVLRGAWGNAGEIGHVPVVAGGEPCPCGNRGCLERYLSLEAFGRSGRSEADWVSEVRPAFHAAITTVENLFDPETVILGGLAPESLLEKLAEAAQRLPNSVAARGDRTAPRITVAHGGPHAVLRGAAALAVSGVLSPRFGRMFATDRERGNDVLRGKGMAA